MKMKRLMFIAGIALTMALVPSCSKEEGCTDNSATNYNADAEEDDGSCTFDSTSTDTTSTGGNTGGGATDSTSTGGNSDGGTDTTTTGGSTGGGTTTGVSEYWFHDDKIKCAPFTENPKIGNTGILSVVSNPCQSSGAKLDGYFKYGSRPSAGTYNIVSNGTNITLPSGDDEFSMIFYSHNSKTWYAVEGTVVLTVNADDSSKLDMNWSDVKMMAADSSTVLFSGSLYSL